MRLSARAGKTENSESVHVYKDLNIHAVEHPLRQLEMNPHFSSSYQSSYQPVYHDAHGHDNGYERSKRKIFPFTLILFTLWVAFIIGLLWLLERAVTHGPRSVHPPWTLTTLPDLLLTVFAQAHGPITAMHLTRIAVSALQYPSSAPNSWKELFWLADHNWEGPVGIVTSAWDSIRSRTRASFTFILFATTCVIGIIIPVVLTSAYEVRQVQLMESVDIQPSTTTFKKMQHVDAYTQVGVGMGSWGTGTSVADIYNTSLFHPEGQQNTNRTAQPREFFFAGDVSNATTTLPGLHLKGSCAPIDIDASGLDTKTLNTTWTPFCRARLGPQFDGSETPGTQNFGGQADFGEFTLNVCSNATWSFALARSPDGARTENTGYAYYQYSLTNATGRGLIQCNSTLTTGTALVSGLNRTYTGFSRQTLYNSSDSTGGEPLLDPLFAAFYHLANKATRDMNFQQGSAIRGLGFQYREDVGASTMMTSASPELISEGLWGAVAHFTSAIAVLSRDTDLTFP
ncbi:hypothetical protein V5O48_005595, partial [Marasmius crinis-equi]